YVRQTGQPAQTKFIPRVLLPLPTHDDSVDLSALRDPEHPTDPTARPTGGHVLLWLELHVPAEAPAGDYRTSCALIEKPGGRVVSSLSIQLTVRDFILPDTPHLQMAAQLNW